MFRKKEIKTNDSLYFMIEQLMGENIGVGKYENDENACDAIVASLLLTSEERSENLGLLLADTDSFNDYVGALNDESKRDALIIAVAHLCKKYVNTTQFLRLNPLSDLVMNGTEVRDGVGINQSGLSAAVATVLGKNFHNRCVIGPHLLQMNDNEKLFFHFLVKLGALTGKSELVFEVSKESDHFSVNQIKNILRRFVRDSMVKVTLKSKSLNARNRDFYTRLLNCKGKLELRLVEGESWKDSDIELISNALKQRESVTFCCDMVPYSEGYIAGTLNYRVIRELSNVKVNVIDTVSQWRSREGSWREFADDFYKKMAKAMDRRCEPQKHGVIFCAAKSKESSHSLFSRKDRQHDEGVKMSRTSTMKPSH